MRSPVFLTAIVLIAATFSAGCGDPCDRTTSVVVFPVDAAGDAVSVDRVEYLSLRTPEFTVCEQAEVGIAWACGINDAGPVSVRVFFGQRITTADVVVGGDNCSIEGVDLEVIVE